MIRQTKRKKVKRKREIKEWKRKVRNEQTKKKKRKKIEIIDKKKEKRNRGIEEKRLENEKKKKKNETHRKRNEKKMYFPSFLEVGFQTQVKFRLLNADFLVPFYLEDFDKTGFTPFWDRLKSILP